MDSKEKNEDLGFDSMSILVPSEIEDLRLLKEKLDEVFICFRRMKFSTDFLAKKYQYHMLELYYCSLLQNMKKFMDGIENKYNLKEDSK